MQRTVVRIPIAPVPKPRMTQRDRWTDTEKRKGRPAVLRYFDFKDDLRKEITGDLDPRFDIVFVIPMPPSWSKKKKADMVGRPHQVKPDVDNYLKSFMDAICKDDSYVYDAHPRKFWGYEGRIDLIERGEDPDERYN